METLSRFPADGWHYDGSFSYGQAELYYAIPHVVVKIFPEKERDFALETLELLRAADVTSARFAEVTHTDGQVHFYVYADKGDFLQFRGRLAPHVEISG